MNSQDFQARLRDLRQLIGSDDQDNQLDSDEHARYQLYRSARTRVAVGELLPVVLGDPDRAMANATLVMLVDSAAPDMTSAEFDSWSEVLDADPSDRSFVQNRLAEWMLLRRLTTGTPEVITELISGSDWVQRKSAEESSDPSVLEALAASARTKRIRSIAASQLCGKALQ